MSTPRTDKELALLGDKLASAIDELIIELDTAAMTADIGKIKKILTILLRHRREIAAVEKSWNPDDTTRTEED